MYETLETVFHCLSKHLKFRQKILCCASYFQLSAWCLDILTKHCLSCLIYYIMKHFLLHPIEAGCLINILAYVNISAYPTSENTGSLLGSEQSRNIFVALMQASTHSILSSVRPDVKIEQIEIQDTAYIQLYSVHVCLFNITMA